MKKVFFIILFMLHLSSGWGQDECSGFTLNVPFLYTACTGDEYTYIVTGPAGTSFSATWDFDDGTSPVSGASVKHTYQSSPPSGGTYYYVTVTIESGGITCTKNLNINTLCLELPPIEEVVPPPGNPFLTGEEGNWRVKRTWVLQMERIQTRKGPNDNLNLRTDGTYRKFYTFWNPVVTPGSVWMKHNDDKWTFKTQFNHYNPFGSFELETVDPLLRFSSAIYGYNHTLPVAISSNSRYREIGFDSFEDYDFGKCANNHFSFQFSSGIGGRIRETTAHSGRRSIRLGPGESITMKKEFAECEDERPPR